MVAFLEARWLIASFRQRAGKSDHDHQYFDACKVWTFWKWPKRKGRTSLQCVYNPCTEKRKQEIASATWEPSLFSPGAFLWDEFFSGRCMRIVRNEISQSFKSVSFFVHSCILLWFERKIKFQLVERHRPICALECCQIPRLRQILTRVTF